MEFKTLMRFKDTDGTVYESNAPYLSDDKDHIIYLITDQNKQNKPVIQVTKQMTVKELKKVSDWIGLDYDSDIKKDELINLLIEGE